ncbi:Cobalamin-independent synthase, Catalytic domain [Nocardioides terrae]|uniref:Cobalamin-independent synthase, Catalytic domain n=1 Tax=Nocardioides terrae TaxID=574651 RepID=A0A1I1ITE9_9ACTN|nr:methionine synthase [Nocardioides terrae]SFC39002.1 Cobalamin-independent synthase, Catalytic domain [Nocardioides terrae]
MIATGIGSLPGESGREAFKVVLGEVPDLPHAPELPARGAIADLTGRTLAVVTGLDADLQPAGWRLTGSSGSSGLDHRRARSLLAQDLDMVEELTQGYGGAFKMQVAGPWTLAATVERPRGDRILADHGARRELAQALAEGVREHVRDIRRRLPAVTRLIVQVDEPGLAAVLAGRVPTASGFGRHRSVDAPEASTALEWVLSAVAEEGAEPWVHSCAPGTPLGLLRGAGAKGLAVDLGLLGAADHETLAEALEAGETVALGVVPSLEPAQPITDTVVVERVLRWLDMVGLDPDDVGDRLVVTPTCGLAGATWAWARQALALARSSAASVGGGVAERRD